MQVSFAYILHGYITEGIGAIIRFFKAYEATHKIMDYCGIF